MVILKKVGVLGTSAAILVLVACASLNACLSINPTTVMARVRSGMDRNQVVAEIGPPDKERGPRGRECADYNLGAQGNVPFSIYFDRNDRVVETDSCPCSMLRIRQLGLGQVSNV